MNDLDWNHIRAFHATATDGSLQRAAARLGLTQPTLSRQVAALEHAMGVALFDRRGRRLTLTDTGRNLLDHVRTMDDAAHAVALAATGRSDTLSGRVTISVIDILAVHLLPRVIARVQAAAPQLSLAVIATDRLSDLHHREADIALRHLPPATGLAGVELGPMNAHFYASTDFVARHGPIETPADLVRAGLIGSQDGGRLAEHLRGIGIPVTDADLRLTTDSGVAMWEMARQGLGACIMMQAVASRTPEMVRLLPTLPAIAVPLWLVTHHELRHTRRVRLVRDCLTEVLAGNAAN